MKRRTPYLRRPAERTRRVAMDIDTPLGLQNAVQMYQSNGNHRQIRHHVVFLEECPHGPQHFGSLPVLADF